MVLDAPAAEESAGAARRLHGTWAAFVGALAVCTTLFHIVALSLYPLDPWLFLGVSLGLFWVLAFLLFPATRGGARTVPGTVQLVDIAWCLAALGVTAYLALNYDAMYDRVGFEPSTSDWVFGLTAVVLTLEMSRRVLGWFFPVMGLLCLAYALFGGGLPGIWGHRGYEFDRTMSTMFSTEGLYGFAMSAAATYIVLFVTFGAFLRATGVGPVFIDLATAIAGRARGCPAKVEVISSALFGTVSGSSIGNVAAVGKLTIPLM